MRARLVFGLGNPGKAGTRHNLGADTLDYAANLWDCPPWHTRGSALYTYAQRWGVSLWLIKPITYMNASGSAVEVHSQGSFLIICDDIHLPLAQLRLRKKGSSGGHKGLADIERELANRDYARLRIGIGHREPLDQYVLEKFSETEQISIMEGMKKACSTIDTWLQEGIGKAIEKAND